jgi:hypothetical protein
MRSVVGMLWAPVTSLCLSACITSSSLYSEKNIHRIAIVPAAGQRLELLGGPFGYKPLGVPLEGVAGTFYEVARSELQKGHRFAVSRLEVPEQTFRTTQQRVHWWTSFPLDSVDRVKVKGALPQLAAKCDCDALLFILDDLHIAGRGGTSTYGMEWAKVPVLFAPPDYSVVRAAYTLLLFDARTSETLAAAWIYVPGVSCPLFPFVAECLYPISDVDGNLFPKGPTTLLTDAQRAALQPQLEKLIHGSLPPALKRMGLSEDE